MFVCPASTCPACRYDMSQTRFDKAGGPRDAGLMAHSTAAVKAAVRRSSRSTGPAPTNPWLIVLLCVVGVTIAVFGQPVQALAAVVIVAILGALAQGCSITPIVVRALEPLTRFLRTAATVELERSTPRDGTPDDANSPASN